MGRWGPVGAGHRSRLRSGHPLAKEHRQNLSCGRSKWRTISELLPRPLPRVRGVTALRRHQRSEPNHVSLIPEESRIGSCRWLSQFRADCDREGTRDPRRASETWFRGCERHFRPPRGSVGTDQRTRSTTHLILASNLTLIRTGAPVRRIPDTSSADAPTWACVNPDYFLPLV